MSHGVGDAVRRIIKNEIPSLVNDAQIRQRLSAGVPTDYLSVILERGFISQQKLDYKQWIRFSNTSTGDEIVIVDARGTFASNGLIINRNGHNINSSAANLTLSTNGQAVTLVYVDTTRGWAFKTNTA